MAFDRRARRIVQFIVGPRGKRVRVEALAFPGTRTGAECIGVERSSDQAIHRGFAA